MVEPGVVIFHVSASAVQDWASVTVNLTGLRRVVGSDRVMTVPVRMMPIDD
ncbi:MAG: hypothetical protein ACKN9D_01875 [Actinomycetales bacterium]